LTLSTATPIYRKTSVQHGLESDLPPNPKEGDQYFATDTGIIYVCYTADVWDVATPLKKESDNTLTFNGKQLYIIDYDFGEQLASSTTTPLNFTFDSEILPTDCVLHYEFYVFAAGQPATVDFKISVNGTVTTLQRASMTTQAIVADFPFTFQPGDVVQMSTVIVSGGGSGSVQKNYRLQINAAEPIRRPVYVSTT
jgi:hypothetical protein